MGRHTTHANIGRMWSEIARAIAERMWALIGALLGLLAWVQSQDVTVRRIALAGAVGFTLLFVVLSVVESLDIRHRHRLADDLARLQHTARKRYVEWWTHCQDPQKAADAEREAEQVRQTITTTLKNRLGDAEATYFNTPKAVEPFPNTTVLNCPKAVLINELGHRIDRLGEIIQRLRAGK